MRKLLRMASNQKGFTLIELLVVVCILGTLAAVVVPAVSSFLGVANLVAANTEAANVKTSAMIYLASNGVFPATSDDLVGIYLSGTPSGEYAFNRSTGMIDSAFDRAGLGITDGLIFDSDIQSWRKP